MDAKLDAKLAIMYLQQACSDEYIEEFREEIKLLISIAERAGDVEGMKKTIKLAKDIKVPLAEFIVRCLTGKAVGDEQR